ncbi:MAG: 1-acyl-sn-glycerol-3-phosphate acyltransferase [Bacteroidales bacterium]|nr:1-acyl-sn-glycerol-3-phosphate acyltransferase [Bacteroidales bacterium]
MKKIYEPDFGYTLVRRIANFYIRGSYRFLEYEGLENIPKDGAAIYSPNHCNTLMDPLVVLAMIRDKMVFVARADIFKKPFLKKVFTFFRIMPINRVRDGFRSVLNVEETVEKSIEVLNNQVPFCILPEGMHRAMHSLLPIGKGIARIAVGADRQKKPGTHIRIVPVGCEYGDYFRYRSSLVMTVGEPIDITAYIADHPEKSESEIFSDIRKMTGEAMKRLIVYIPDDEDYDATWEIARLRSGHQVPECRPKERMKANRAEIEKIGRLREESPEKAKGIFEKALAYGEARKRARVSTHATYTRRPVAKALWSTLKALVCAPFGLAFAAVSVPIWGVGEKLAAGLKDPAFRNSFRCGVNIIVWTLLLLIAAVVLFCTVKWYWAIAALVLLLPAPMLAYDWFEQVRRLASSWRYACNGSLRKQKDELMEEMEKLDL